MEKFFKKPFLDILYNSISEEFEELIIKDKKQNKQYNEFCLKQDKCYNMLKKIVNEDEQKLNAVKQVIREIEQCNSDQINYWNRKYFKLGFIYMLKLKIYEEETKTIPLTNKNMNIKFKDEALKEFYSFTIHNFLENLRHLHLNETSKISFFNFINNLEKATKKQKRRFLMYYNLIPDNNKVLGYADIGKIENCRGSAVKISVISVVSQLVNLDENKRKTFLDIIKSIDNQSNL